MSDGICSICLNNFNNKISTKCKHSFCKDCIMDWISINNNCPMCRNIIILYFLKMNLN